jgi:hypothetical protein
MQLHRVQPHLDAIGPGVLGNCAIGGKQGQLRVPLRSFIKGFDQMAPSLTLAVVDLAQVQHLPLHRFATRAALALDNIPVAMFFAILETSIESQKHDANQLTPNRDDEIDTWSTLQTICHRSPLIRARPLAAGDGHRPSWPGPGCRPGCACHAADCNLSRQVTGD